MINWQRVNELKSEIGEDDFLEVVEMFLEEADQVCAWLDGPSDLKSVESRLHFLKGSALNLGLTDLAVLCQNGEKTAASGAAAHVDVAAVATCYRASKIQLLESLGRSAAA